MYSSGVASPSLFWKGPAPGAKATIPAPRKQKTNSFGFQNPLSLKAKLLQSQNTAESQKFAMPPVCALPPAAPTQLFALLCLWERHRRGEAGGRAQPSVASQPKTASDSGGMGIEAAQSLKQTRSQGRASLHFSEHYIQCKFQQISVLHTVRNVLMT